MADGHPSAVTDFRNKVGQIQKSTRAIAMSAFPPLATRQRTSLEVRFVPTLLRKSVTADGCPSAIRLLTTGFDLPALMLVTQLQRYAIHGAIVGGGRAPSDANRRRF